MADNVYENMIKKEVLDLIKNKIITLTNIKNINQNNLIIVLFFGGTSKEINFNEDKIYNNYNEIIKYAFETNKLPIFVNGATKSGHIAILEELFDKYKNKKTFLTLGYTSKGYKKYDNKCIKQNLIKNDIIFLYGDNTSDYGIETEQIFETITPLLLMNKNNSIFVSFLNGGIITYHEFLYSILYLKRKNDYFKNKKIEKVKFILHYGSGRFTDGLINSYINNDQLKFENKKNEIIETDLIFSDKYINYYSYKKYSTIHNKIDNVINDIFKYKCNEYDNFYEFIVLDNIVFDYSSDYLSLFV